MAPGDLALWRSACDRESDIICRAIVGGVERGELGTFPQIEQAMVEAVDRLPLAQPPLLAELCRSMPSAFALDDATLARLAATMRETVAPGVRRRVEDRIPTRYRDPTPMIVRVQGAERRARLDNPETRGLVSRLLAATTHAEQVDVVADGLTAIIQMDYDDCLGHLTNAIADRVTQGELATAALRNRAVDDAVATCPLTQPEWLTAYIDRLPGHPPVPEPDGLARWIDSLRRTIPLDIRLRLAIRLPTLFAAPAAPAPRPAP